MLAVENYLAEIKLSESTSAAMPSAPLEEASTSSQEGNFTPNINMTECVICLDSQVRFLISLCYTMYLYLITSLRSKSIIIDYYLTINKF